MQIFLTQEFLLLNNVKEVIKKKTESLSVDFEIYPVSLVKDNAMGRHEESQCLPPQKRTWDLDRSTTTKSWTRQLCTDTTLVR